MATVQRKGDGGDRGMEGREGSGGGGTGGGGGGGDARDCRWGREVMVTTQGSGEGRESWQCKGQRQGGGSGNKEERGGGRENNHAKKIAPNTHIKYCLWPLHSESISILSL